MNYLYYQFWTKESLSFSEAVAHKCSIKELRIKFCQNSLATFFKKRTPTQVYFREFSEILLKTLSCRTSANGWFWILQVYMSHSIICFIKWNSKKGNYYFLNIFNRILAPDNYRQKGVWKILPWSIPSRWTPIWVKVRVCVRVRLGGIWSGEIHSGGIDQGGILLKPVKRNN